MRIEFIAENVLKLILTKEREWVLFDKLAVDVEGRGEGWLAKRLGVLMDDEEWDDLVVPGLTAQFEEDYQRVHEMVRSAFLEWKAQQLEEKNSKLKRKVPIDLSMEEEEEEFGAIYITKEDCNAWYSVFNQARLALEGKWKLASLKNEEELGALENVEAARLAAFLRDGFYTKIQAVLLDTLYEL